MRCKGGVGDPEQLHQQGIKLRLDRADGNVLAVGAGIGVVEMCGAVEQVVAALVAPHVLRMHAVHHGRQQRGAVGHRGVHHLALARRFGLEQRAHQTKAQQHAAAAEVADVVQRHRRFFTAWADGVQRAGQCDVVDVVPRRVRQWAGLAPTRHAAVNQARIECQTSLWAQAQTLHHTGAKTFDQGVRFGDDFQHCGQRRGVTQIGVQGLFAARKDIELFVVCASFFRPGNAQHLGTHVGQQHAAKGRRAKSGHLDHFQSSQRACHFKLL